MTRTAALVLTLLIGGAAGLPAGYAGDAARDPYGTSVQAGARRALSIDASTRFLRVEHHEIVTMKDRRGMSFTWQFDTFYCPTGFPLKNIAPDEFDAGDTWVYVHPRADVPAD